MHNDELFSSFQVRNYQLADWKYEKIMEEIRDFEKSLDGKDSQLIQHANQLNFLITSVEREDKTKPARRIGFRAPDDADE